MDELIERLLRKDPHDRYQTAEAVLFDLEGIAASLHGGAGESDYVVGLHDRRPTLTEPAFIGHQDDLEQVDGQIRQVADGRAGLVFIEAESGGGKTRFLAEVALRGAQSRMWVCTAADWKWWDGGRFRCCMALLKHVIAASQIRSRLRRNLCTNDWAITLPPLPPCCRKWLERWVGKSRRAAGPESFAETGAFRRSPPFLDALGGQGSPGHDRPGRLPMGRRDDGQIDGAVAAGAGQLGREGRPTLLVVAFRSEEVAADHPLRMIHPSLHLRLAPFVADELRRLLESMAGPLPAEAVDVVSQTFQRQSIHGVRRAAGDGGVRGALGRTSGWRIEPSALADLQSSGQSAGFCRGESSCCRKTPWSLLTVGAVLGKEFDLKVAAKLMRCRPPRPSRPSIWREQGTSYGCSRVKRSASSSTKDPRRLAGSLSSEVRQELHHRIAHHLREEDAGRIFDLAYHFDAAGDHESALPYALQAAEQARAQYALEIAEKQYRIARRDADSAERATRYEIAKGLGDVLMLRGRYNEAGEFLASPAW